MKGWTDFLEAGQRRADERKRSVLSAAGFLGSSLATFVQTTVLYYWDWNSTPDFM